ncbi:MAG TPA: TlpA disulfide reductase family protein [Thermodesulfobacteriota bacterium]|nr:TlpA disulfide reductase family protein [Thermodesulfobacteriota bacterium]
MEREFREIVKVLKESKRRRYIQDFALTGALALSALTQPRATSDIVPEIRQEVFTMDFRYHFRRFFTKGIILYAFFFTILLPPPAHPVENAYLKDLSIQALGGKAPGLMVRGDSKEVRLADYRGKVVMLHFWAMCKPCVKEMPALESLYRRFNDKGLAFLAITTEPKANRGEINAFAKRLGITFPIYFVGDGEVPDSYWAAGEPQTYLIDKKGNLIGRAFGPRDWGTKEATGLISRLLEEN